MQHKSQIPLISVAILAQGFFFCSSRLAGCPRTCTALTAEVAWAVLEVLGPEVAMEVAMEVATAVRSQGLRVDTWVERVALQETAAVLHKARTALRAASVAEAAVQAAALCLMLAMAMGSISRRPRISMWDTAETSTCSGRDEISPASSRAAAF